MEQELHHARPNYNDILTSRTSTSRFIFYLYVAIMVAFFLGMCYGLYVHRYKGKPNVEIPSSTLYNPTYK
ncbi:MAG: hypothetical protein IRZ29_01110 [Thermoflavifilum sp.]|nr:hypothetical protein [Thermoflavifilum sp.]